MPIRAGQKITAARLNWDSDSVALSNATPSAADTDTDWGTETVTFANPGVAVKVQAWVAGKGFRSSASQALGRVKVAISFDGGSTFVTGTQVSATMGDVAGGARNMPVSAHGHRAGTPTASIVVKGVVQSSVASGIAFNEGHLMAAVVPQ